MLIVCRQIPFHGDHPSFVHQYSANEQVDNWTATSRPEFLRPSRVPCHLTVTSATFSHNETRFVAIFKVLNESAQIWKRSQVKRRRILACMESTVPWANRKRANPIPPTLNHMRIWDLNRLLIRFPQTELWHYDDWKLESTCYHHQPFRWWFTIGTMWLCR